MAGRMEDALRQEEAQRVNRVTTGDDPYYVGSNEMTGVSIISDVLTGPENYTKWRRSMEISLSARSKLGFVRGDYPKPSDVDLQLKWQKCNDVVMSWLISSVSRGIAGTILHAKDAMTAWPTLKVHMGGFNETRLFGLERDIGNFTQGDLIVAGYYQKLIDMREELDVMEELPSCTHGESCTCFTYILEKAKRRKIVQFFMRLNESFLPL